MPGGHGPVLQRDPCNALMPTADTQTGSGLSGRVDTRILKSGVCRWWESDEPPQSVGGEKLPERPPKVPGRDPGFEPPPRGQHSLSPSHAGCPHCKKAIPHFTATADTFRDDRKVRTLLLFIPCPSSSFALPPVPIPSSLPSRSPSQIGSADTRGTSTFLSIRQDRAD